MDNKIRCVRCPCSVHRILFCADKCNECISNLLKYELTGCGIEFCELGEAHLQQSLLELLLGLVDRASDQGERCICLFRIVSFCLATGHDVMGWYWN